LKAKKSDSIQTIKEKFNLKFNDSGKLIAENKETYQTYEIDKLLSEMLKDYAPKDSSGMPNPKPPLIPPVGKLQFTKEMNGQQRQDLVVSHLIATGRIKSKMDKNFAKEYETAYNEAKKGL
jgi:hypothetical protein